jgi:hypothetical protein
MKDACEDSVIRAHDVARDSPAPLHCRAHRETSTACRSREGRSMDRGQDGMVADLLAAHSASAEPANGMLPAGSEAEGYATRHAAADRPLPLPDRAARTATDTARRATGSACCQHRTTAPAATRAWRIGFRMKPARVAAHPTTERARRS